MAILVSQILQELLDSRGLGMVRSERQGGAEMGQDFLAVGFPGTGLALPEQVLKKVYYDNVLKWFPGAEEDYEE